MDLRLYGRVLWRFRWIVGLGFVLALALGFLAIAKVSFAGGKPHITYRNPPTYASTADVLITQRGFAEGYANPNIAVIAAKGYPAGVAPKFTDAGHLSYLAVLYSELFVGDKVRSIMAKEGGLKGALTAAPVTVAQNLQPLPIVHLTGLSSTAGAAEETASHAIRAAEKYMEDQQVANNIPESQRVILEVVSKPAGAFVYKASKKTKGVFVFIVVLIAAIALAFILENLRPRVRPVSDVRRLPDAEAAGQ